MVRLKWNQLNHIQLNDQMVINLKEIKQRGVELMTNTPLDEDYRSILIFDIFILINLNFDGLK